MRTRSEERIYRAYKRVITAYPNGKIAKIVAEQVVCTPQYAYRIIQRLQERGELPTKEHKEIISGTIDIVSVLCS